MNTVQNTRLGIWLMVATTFVFAMQDGISRHLAGEYNVLMVVMIRYWFFAAFVMAVAARKAGGLRAAAATSQPGVQIFRGVLLATEICVMVLAFVLLGLVESHAVFTSYPLLIAALSGPILGEKVGWRRWTAIGVGFVGVLIILQPGFRVFQVEALVPLAAALMFALYALMTQYVNAPARIRGEPVSSTHGTVWSGGVMTSRGHLVLGPPMTGRLGVDGTLLCVTGALGALAAIKVYDVADSHSAVQPFAYLQAGLAAIGLGIHGVRRDAAWNVAIGCGAGWLAGGNLTLAQGAARERGSLGRPAGCPTVGRAGSKQINGF